MNLDNFVVKSVSLSFKSVSFSFKSVSLSFKSVSFSIKSSFLTLLFANSRGNKNNGKAVNKSKNPKIRNPNHQAPIHLGSFDFMSSESVYNF